VGPNQRCGTDMTQLHTIYKERVWATQPIHLGFLDLLRGWEAGGRCRYQQMSQALISIVPLCGGNQLFCIGKRMAFYRPVRATTVTKVGKT